MASSPDTAARRPSVTAWWLAAIAAVIAVAVAVVLLAGARPTPDVLPAPLTLGKVPAQISPAPLAAGHAPSAVQVATTRKVKATEAAAQSAAANADATAQNIAADEPAPR